MTSEWDQLNLPPCEDNIFLIFGYGSILWKQNFEFVTAYDAYIKGYQRFFYQGSRDHRGTREKPGRVVTLLPDDAASRVYGRAYQLPSEPAKLLEILRALDVREQGGYERVEVTLYNAKQSTPDAPEQPLDIFSLPYMVNHHPRENAADNNGATLPRSKKNVVCLCYMATPGNDDYLGPAPIEQMAAQIVDCVGPSGPNKDYLFHLADCLRDMGADDPHVYALDAAARQIMRTKE